MNFFIPPPPPPFRFSTVVFFHEIKVKRNILCCVVSHSMQCSPMCWLILYMVSHRIVERMHKSGINYKSRKAKDFEPALKNPYIYIQRQQIQPHTLPSHSFTSKRKFWVILTSLPMPNARNNEKKNTHTTYIIKWNVLIVWRFFFSSSCAFFSLSICLVSVSFSFFDFHPFI